MALASSRTPVGEPLGTSRLEVVIPAPASRERAAAVLGIERRTWLAEPADNRSDQAWPARFLLDLELRVSDAAPRVSFRKAALVEVGPLDVTNRGPLVIEIAWRAAGLTPLFPVFAGRLSWHAGELKLEGVYAPPGGAVGDVADRLLLNVAAHGIGRRLLERIAEAMAQGEGR
jgi:hypothetical protein